MSRRMFPLLVIGLALALLLVLGWRAFAPAESGAPPARPEPGAGTTANAALGSPSPPPAATGEPAVNVARVDAASGMPQRRVRILDENRAPVANAEVVFDLSEELRTTWQPLAFDVERRLAGSPRYRSASDGIVLLPTDAAVAFVLARAGERLGHRVIELDSALYDVPELAIAPDRTLRIAVVGPNGEPRPNVPVEVTFQDEEALVGIGTSTRELPRTGSDGVTVFWHAQTLNFWNQAEAAVELRAIVYGAEPPARRVVFAEPLPERVALECPDHGGIRVRAAGGRAGAGGALHPWLGEAGDEMLSAPTPTMLLPGATPVEACVFPVALGKTWKVGANARFDIEPQLAEKLVAFAGPVRHGDEVVVELPQEVTRLCTARLLQPDGQPCRLQRIDFDRWEEPRWAETDADGRLTAPVIDNQMSFHCVSLHARARVPVRTDAGVRGPVDLGTVQLVALSLLASGRVVDAATGRPVQAFVRARGNVSGTTGAIASATAGIDGAFELWGESAERFDLRVEKLGYTTASLDLAPGARDVVVALQPARLLRATVLVDPSIAVEDLEVSVHAGDDAKIWRVASIEGGRFHALFELPDGDDLVLVVAGRDELPPLRRVPAAQWTQQDGVFATTVDLRGELTNVLVTVRQSDPKADVDGMLYVRPADGSAPWSRVFLARHLAFAVPNGTSLDAIVEPDGGSCVRTTLRPGENTIEVPAPGLAQIEVLGLPPGVARDSITVQVYWLVRREPLLDELLADGVDSLDPGAIRDWPRSAADVEQVDDDDCIWNELGVGPIRLPLWRRGSYVAVPYAGAKGKRVPLLDAAVPIEITTPGAVVEATIRLDPEKVRAALK